MSMTPPDRQPTPWWWPTMGVAVGVGLFALTWWILWTLAPAKNQEPSELFKLLAQAIVLTGFIGGTVSAVYVISRDGQKKNDIIAQQAKVIADQSTPAAAPPPAETPAP